MNSIGRSLRRFDFNLELVVRSYIMRTTGIFSSNFSNLSRRSSSFPLYLVVIVNPLSISVNSVGATVGAEKTIRVLLMSTDEPPEVSCKNKLRSESL